MPDFRLGRLNGQFVVVWYANGRRYRRRLGTKNPAEARAALADIIREQQRPAQQRLTVAEIWADYVAEKRAQGKVSVDRMGDAWKRLAPVYSSLLPGDISAGLVRDYTSSRRGHGASDGTIHTELGYLRASLRHAGAPATFKLPSKPRPKSRHLTPDEARRLIDAAQMPHVRLFILLALHTAGRPSSILDLTWDRVGIERGQIHLDNPARDRTAKGRATVPIPVLLYEPLNDAKRSALTNHVIEWAGKPVKSVKKAITRAASRAGVEATPYTLRHTAAVWMAEAGVPMVEIAQMMGHNNPATTYRVYARFSPEYLRKASDAISTALQGQPGPDAVKEK